MNKDLTTSQVARKNILNNPYALSELETNLAVGGKNFAGETVFTKMQVAEILAVDERTIDRYLSGHNDELENSGYRILKGKALRKLRLAYVDDMNVVDISPKTPSLGIFSFRALLNLAMLITESDRAKAIRSRMLDIVIDVIAEKSGGHTKYVNQRDPDYLPAAFLEESYRKQFTDALRDHLQMGNHKYAVYTDRVYQAVFCENAMEYKQILRLADKDKTRETMYTEVLKAIASFEHGLAVQLKTKAEALGRKLAPAELDTLINEAEKNPFLQPSIEDARVRMASRDLGFRDALHEKLEHYLQSVPAGDYERFLGERSRSLEEQLSDIQVLNVLKRLKDR
ncbi:DNA-binding protein [Rahnella woolbedingensis]|uniref:DNA-binding protein n=1 Tax=Rahnella woolbedingensis TaxID=1510574 RepID=A0A419N6C2_9GAMM|nr:DNA-binding protein [Rahnella woolbedingensis]RJT42826.1 DNA-binding protein [Rahnella woolbedingensis]